MALDLINQTVIRWNDPDARHVPLLTEGGITAVAAPPNEGFERACAAAGIACIPGEKIRLLGLDDAGKAAPGEIVLIKTGQWPGTRNPDATVASATRGLWMNQNCYLAGCVRALHPRLPPLLGYLPDADAGVQPGRVVRFESLELALIDAWAAGGNYVMALESRFREALLNRAQDALTAWRSLGSTARWLRANVSLFRRPVLPVVTVLVDHNMMSVEIANLCYRHSVSPSLAAAANPPALDPRSCLVLSAAGIDPPEGDVRRRILAHAAAGATVVADEPGEKAWWRVPGLKLLRADPDREFFSAGKGQIVAYKEPISDPGEFALDLIDIVGQGRRATRLFNSQAGVAIATATALHVINYGQRAGNPVLARIQGKFKRATLMRPESDPVEIAVAPRGTASEVAIPQLLRLATVLFQN